MGPAVVLVAGLLASAMLLTLYFSLSQRFVAGSTIEGWTLQNYLDFARQPYYWRVVLNTLQVAAITTLIAALVGYPVAYVINGLQSGAARTAAYFLLFAPLMTSVIVRAYGWQLLLGDGGLINSALRAAGLAHRPIPLLFSFAGVIIGMVHVLLPFMVFPIMGVMNQVQRAWRDAASDLGASGRQVFTRVTLPLTLQGVVVGCQLVFALAASAFATPAILGGGRVLVLSALIYSDVGQVNWPMAAVESYVLVGVALLVMVAFNWLTRLVPGARTQ